MRRAAPAFAKSDEALERVMDAVPIRKRESSSAADRPITSHALPSGPAPAVEFMPFVHQVTPCEPSGLLPAPFTVKPFNGPGIEPIAPVACVGGIIRRSEQREDVRFLARQRFEDCGRGMGGCLQYKIAPLDPDADTGSSRCFEGLGRVHSRPLHRTMCVLGSGVSTSSGAAATRTFPSCPTFPRSALPCWGMWGMWGIFWPRLGEEEVLWDGTSG